MRSTERFELAARLGVTTALLAFAFEVQSSLEGVAGTIVGGVIGYWLPIGRRAAPRRESDPP